MSQHLGARAAAYVDGMLAPAELALVGAHLAGCAQCRAQVAEQRRIRDVLRETGQSAATPPHGLLAQLAAMPERGAAVRTVATAGRPRAGTLLRGGAVTCVALSATLLGTAWLVGGSAAEASGPPAVTPATLLAQHAATAGELPFWGSGGPSTSTETVNTRPGGSLARWVTRDPTAILHRAALASSSLSYRAVEQVTSFAGTVPHTEVAEVDHISGRGTATQGMGADAGVGSFQPQASDPTSSGPDAVTLLEQTYRVAGEGTDLVAGRTVDRIAVLGADGRVAARFWIDRASGLPLARETRLDGQPSVVRRITALSVTDPSGMPVHLPMSTGAAWGAATPVPDDRALARLEGHGWVCPAQLGSSAGLRLFDVLLADADASGSQGEVLHIIYTDGLRSVSVFQQHAVLSLPRLDGFVPSEVSARPVYRRDADPTEVTWSAGGMVFTVIGDVPAPMLDAVVADLPHDQRSLSARTGRGLARVGSWLDPFG